MMNLTDMDRAELAPVKQFWNKYSRVIVLFAIFFVVLFTFINYWQGRSHKAAAKASQVFQEMFYAEMQQDNDGAIAKGKQLMTEFKSTPYAQFASLLLAKMSVTQGDLDAAIENLQWVLENKSSHAIAQHLATVRLVAVLQQQGKLDEAFALVKNDPDPAYLSLYAQARGDVLVAQGDLVAAKQAYKLAMQSLPAGVKAPILQMKLMDLGSENEA